MPTVKDGSTLLTSLKDFQKTIFPVVTVELIKEAIKEEPDFDVIAKIIGVDPGLTTTILTLVNSPFYGMTQKVVDLQRAAVVLGNREILKLALSITFQSNIKEKLSQCRGDELGNWTLLLWSAVSAQVLAERICPEEANQAYLCTLLKDISLLLLCFCSPSYLPDYEGEEVLLCIHKNQLKMEKETLGYTHPQLSKELLRHWQFPARYCEAVTCHHDFDNVDGYEPFTKAIILATKWSEVEYLSPKKPDLLIQFQSQLMQILDLTNDEVETIRRDCLKRYTSLLSILLPEQMENEEGFLSDLPLEEMQNLYFMSLDIQDMEDGLDQVIKTIGKHLSWSHSIRDFELGLIVQGNRKWKFFRSREGKLSYINGLFDEQKSIPWSKGALRFPLAASGKKLGEFRIKEKHLPGSRAVKEIQLYCRFLSISLKHYLEKQVAIEIKAQTLDKLAVGVAWLNEQGEILDNNKSLVQFLGQTTQTLEGKRLQAVLHDYKGLALDQDWTEFLKTPQQDAYNRVFCPLGLGSTELESCFYISAHREEIGGIEGILVFLEDITEVTDLQTQALVQRDFLQGILESMRDIVLTVDRKGIIHFASIEDAEKLKGKNLFSLAKPLGIFMDSWTPDILYRQEGPLKVNLHLDKNTIKPLELIISEIKNDPDTFLVVGRDLSTIMRLEEKIKRQAIYDHLTNVFNRHQFQFFLDREIVRAERSGQLMGMIFFDIDGFKEFNDKQGHLAGDNILRDVGRILRHSVRKGMDFPCRFGGDEFVILMTGIGGKENLDESCRRIKHKLTSHFEGLVHFSFGLALYRQGEMAEDLVNKADKAAFQAKKSGGDKIIWAET